MSKYILLTTIFALAIPAAAGAVLLPHSGSVSPPGGVAPLLLVTDHSAHKMSAAPAPAFVPAHVGDLDITAGAIKAMTPGQPVGGGYVTIVNRGGADDRLVSVSVTTGAARVELHEMSMQNDVMIMRKLPDGVALPAGQTVEMKPGGLHMMLMGVTAPYKPGDIVHATLTFDKAGSVEIDIPVVDMRPGAKAMKM
jgi:copper(I)-binding protein